MENLKAISQVKLQKVVRPGCEKEKRVYFFALAFDTIAASLNSIAVDSEGYAQLTLDAKVNYADSDLFRAVLEIVVIAMFHLTPETRSDVVIKSERTIRVPLSLLENLKGDEWMELSTEKRIERAEDAAAEIITKRAEEAAVKDAQFDRVISAAAEMAKMLEVYILN
jgi:hypothetical protein